MTEELELNEEEFEEEQQIKSRERVKDHGEVFTNKREVNAMLDLVKDESYRVDSRFLEPACGTGNFLVEIIDRKMKTVLEAHNADQADFEKHTIIAVASIYGIDIQEDNCQESRARMFEIVEGYYSKAYPDSQDDKFLETVEKLLELNIILGDGLKGLQVDEDNMEGYADRPIVFSEFTFDGDYVTRKDFKMNDITEHNKSIEEKKNKSKAVKKNAVNIESGGIFNFGAEAPAPKKTDSKEVHDEVEPFEEFEPVVIDKLITIL